MDTLVSVIIPTHNRLASLQRAVASVLQQTYQAFEIIIIDDNSADATQPYLATLAAYDDRIQYITNTQSKGGAQARNQGIDLARGEWLAFLDDDDTWLPQKLALQLACLQEDASAVACTAPYQVNYPLGMKKTVWPPAQIAFATLLKNNCLGGASVCLCHAQAVKRIGGFDAKLRSAQDWDLWLRLREIGTIVTCNDILVDYYVHFNYRISNDMQAKYKGARRFYFKYQQRMVGAAKTVNIAFLAFIKSRQSYRSLRYRCYYLTLALKHSTFRTARAYFLSSMPRIMLQSLRRLIKPAKT